MPFSLDRSKTDPAGLGMMSGDMHKLASKYLLTWSINITLTAKWQQNFHDLPLC